MVHHHHEHGSALAPAPPTPLQRVLATNHIRDIFRPQHHSFHPVQHHHRPAIPDVSKTVAGGCSTSPPEPIPGDVPSRIGHTGQHDGPGVCAGLGSRYGHLRLGVMVDRQFVGAHNLLPLDVCNVSGWFSLPISNPFVP